MEGGSSLVVPNPPKVRPLREYALLVILGNMDSLTSLGDMPYRLAKPILENCALEKLIELETNSPHIIADDDEIWRDLYLKRFGIAMDEESESVVSWRGHYNKRVELERQLEDEAGQRIRLKREALEAEKNERRIQYTPATFKSGRGVGNGKTTIPKTLMGKARHETKKIATIFHAPVARNIVSIPTSPTKRRMIEQPRTLTTSPAASASAQHPSIVPIASAVLPILSALAQEPRNAVASTSKSKPIWDFQARKEGDAAKVPVVVTTVTKTLSHPRPKSTSRNARPSSASTSTSSSTNAGSPPSIPFAFSPPPNAPPFPAPAKAPTAVSPPAMRKPKDATMSLFMPKHKAFSQLPSPVRPAKLHR